MKTVNETTSIVLISKETGATSGLGSVLRSNPKFNLEECNATLSEINGKASNLASQNDLVIFQAEANAENDIAAISGLRDRSGDDAIILALSDASTTLADVQRLTRAGVNQVLADTISASELEELIGGWTNRAGQTGARQNGGGQGKLISIAQARGGVGATTLAVNLADQFLGRKGRIKKVAQNRVALVDLNLQFGAISSFLDLEPREALYQLAMDGTEPDETFLSQSMAHMPSGMSVLCAPSRIAPLEALQSGQVKKLVHALRAEFDYVVLDLPRALVEWVAPVLEESDRMLLVTDSSVPSVHQARRLIDFYSDDNLALPIDVVVNFETKPMMLSKHHTEAAKVLERPLRHWLANDPKAAREAVDRGAPLSQVAARSALGKSIKRLAQTTMSELAEKQTSKSADH